MKKFKKKNDPSGLFIPAGIFIGMGIGFLLDNVVMGLFFGLGIGFLGMAIAQLVLKSAEKKAKK